MRQPQISMQLISGDLPSEEACGPVTEMFLSDVCWCERFCSRIAYRGPIEK